VSTKVSNEDFARAWHNCGGSPSLVAQATGLSIRAVYGRRGRMSAPLQTVPLTGAATPYSPPAHFERRRKFEVTDGTVVVFSDPHWLPDHSPVAQDALESLIRDLKPQLVVCGGDALDGTQISRWDPTRGHHKPYGLREQLGCMRMHLDALRVVAGKARLAWTLGNHDLRLSRYVATRAEHLLELDGTRLEDWAPQWPLSWTVEVNPGGPGMTVIRHRNQAGMLHLQAVKAGCHYVHGHLHRLNVHTAATFSGYKYSVDAGALSDPDSDAFDYAEGAPAHAQGFAVLTYNGGKLMPPELCVVIDGKAWFRGGYVA
jgi:hypothetical protein